MFNERTPRDQDTARFLFEVQRDFYRDTIAYLRELGFRGVINASNWTTASPECFGPLEKLSYAEGDFIDRHGYFSCSHEGDNAAWSIRDGHTYLNRSALRFDPGASGEPRQFNHPAMDPHYAGKPSMISETTFNRPNRHRSEAPLFYAVYGALQDSNAIVHFALDGESWDVKPRFWMQPWTLLSPAMAGQFPAAALIYRQSLIRTGDVLAEVDLGLEDLFALRGTPLPQDAALDELRAADLPAAPSLSGAARLDPLLHFAGRCEVRFHHGPTRVSALSLEDLIDRKRRRVRSSTGEIQLDYERGVLRIDAPRAQGFSGNLAAAGPLATRWLHVESPLDLGHIVLVSLDSQPLDRSRSMLLQVMSEEQTTGFRTKSTSRGLLQIESIGVNPWQVRWLTGVIRLTRPGAGALTVTALDANGYPRMALASAESFPLLPDCLYYHIHH
ncbi:MAG TPA: hypothetical protein VMN36_04325 [Verrucomicrobiales bacterium]|nr:hypothetical protein [Verrucomicrobiales bacterium]